jgi:DNA polymerase III alpha subunit (gram-positive type)
MKMQYVILDITTTGANKYWHNILEVCAIKISKDGILLDRFTSLVKPNKKISSRELQLSPISKDLITKAPTAFNVIPLLCNFIDDYMPVILDPYLIGFINKEISLCNMYIIDNSKLNYVNKALCISESFKKCYPTLPADLKSICNFYNLRTKNIDRAYGKAIAIKNIFGKMQQEQTCFISIDLNNEGLIVNRKNAFI